MMTNRFKTEIIVSHNTSVVLQVYLKLVIAIAYLIL
jgi:hypothetical protein